MMSEQDVHADVQLALAGFLNHGALCRATLKIVRAGVAVTPAHLEALLAQGAQLGEDLERLRLVAAEIELKNQGKIGQA
jgi:uncharacterized protein (DUF934 family)